MSIDLIKLVRNDDLPRLFVQIIDDETGEPIDLSDARNVVTQKFRAKGDTETLFSATMVKRNDGTLGEVIWDWPATGLTDLTPGRYEGEVSIDFNGERQTVVERIPFKVIEDFEEVVP